MINSIYGGFITPQDSPRSKTDFIPQKEKGLYDNTLVYTTVKMLIDACDNCEDILSIDSVPVDIICLIGRI